MATIIATSINVTPLTVPCYTCHQPVVQASAQPICLLTPSGRYHDGHAVLKMGETVYECDSCFTASASAEEHLYTVYACSTTKTVGAATPEDAAALMLQAHGCRSTRSVAVIGSGVRCEYLDCEVMNGALQFAEQVQLP